MKHITQWLKLPYTPVLCITGIVVGLFTDDLSTVGKGLKQFGNIDPHTLLLIFLPALIFESAFHCDWHIFKMEFL